MFLVVAGLIEYFHLDLALADFLYRLEGDHWALKRHFLTATVVHEYGRHLVQVLVFALVGLIIRDWRQGRKRQLAAGLYLFACFAITTLTVSVLRHLTHVTCPWDLLRYGGEVAYVPIFSPLPPGMEAGACFPAGHASSAYAWVALYYYFRVVSARYRWYGLAFGLALGLTFDIAQQLRGAHFVSHGLWTLGIAWCVATGVYLLTLNEKT